MSGAFLMSRDIFGHEIWTDVAKFRLFFYIVGNAVWSEEGVKKGGIQVGRGQFLRSYRNIREDLVYYDNNAEKKYSLSLIKKKIDDLIQEDMLKVEETKLGTLFTVVNYQKYQAFDHYKTESSEHHENTMRTQREQRENNKNKDIKDNKEISTTTKRQGSSGPTDYQRRLLHRYVELRGSGLFHSPKDQQEAIVIESAGVPLEMAIGVLESKFAEFTPRHAKDKINSLSYCTGAILDAHYRTTQQQGSAEELEQQQTNQPRYNYGF